MDSFELNKIMGAILGTCLVLLVTNFTAQAIFSPKKPEKPGFEIAVKEDAGGAAAAAAAPAAPMKAKGGNWSEDDLYAFIANPKAFVPGTAMGFAGIAKDSERADLIAYLATLK
jgi:cytochrome c